MNLLEYLKQITSEELSACVKEIMYAKKGKAKKDLKRRADEIPAFRDLVTSCVNAITKQGVDSKAYISLDGMRILFEAIIVIAEEERIKHNLPST